MFSQKNLLTAFALCALLLSARMSAAQSSHAPLPRTLSYQGVLAASGSGIHPAGNRLLTVTLYGDANGTIKLWHSTMNTTLDSNGVFNVMLGTADDPLPSTAAMDRPLWVGVAVDHGLELRPLSEVTASAYALNVVDNAITTAKLADNAVTTAKIADSSITASKVNMDYISSININGVQFTGHGTPLNVQGRNGITAAFLSDSNTLVLSGATNNTNPGLANGAPGTTNTPDTSAGCVNSDGGLGANTVPGGCTNTIHAPIDYSSIGGGKNNTITNVLGTNPHTEYNDGHTIAGGEGNTIYAEINSNLENGKYGYGTISGGQDNTLVGPEWGSIGGGANNIISSKNPPADDDKADGMAGGVIGGGEFNSITTASKQATIGGGYNNQIHGILNLSDSSLVNDANQATIGGGENNVASNTQATIAGGDSNQATGAISTVAGGADNVASGIGSTVGGGTVDIASGQYSVIPGGEELEVGNNSFGFSGSSSGAVISSFPNTAYFGDVDLWIGNVDDRSRALRFYSANSSYDYSGATYSSFQAGSQSANIIYTLPTVAPDSIGRVLAVSSISPPYVSLTWAANGSGGSGIAGWLLQGNAGTVPGTNYLGTQDSEAFEIHVNNGGDTTAGNGRVMRFEPGPTSPNIIGGSRYNYIWTVDGAAVLAGGTLAEPNVSTYFSTVSGGSGNAIKTASEYSDIGGGRNNMIEGSFESAIAGGYGGYMSASDNSFIGSGIDDTLYGSSSTIGGGDMNSLDGNESVIAGGNGNGLLVDAFGYGAFLGGGETNWLLSSWSTLTGGSNNAIDLSAEYSFLGGGEGNLIEYGADHATIAGGGDDTIGMSANYSVLGGGNTNSIGSEDTSSAILGGQQNKIDANSNFSTLVCGADNYMSSGPYSFQGGGLADTITSELSVIVGGCFNKVLGTKWGAIEGGCTNIITDTFGFIGGGNHNTVSAPAGTIAGGQLNIAAGEFGTVSGGDSNLVFGYAGFIGGGLDNIIANLPGNSTIPLEGTIGGGLENAIGPLNAVYLFPLPSTYILPVAATVGGGLEDTASGHFSAVTGGWDNRAIGKYAAVLGGRGLLAQDYQTVVGRYNDTNTLGGGLNNTGDAFTSPPPMGGGNNALVPEQLLNPDAPTFIVGNGGITEWPDSTGQDVITEHRSNAFTVSDDGHSTAYQSLGKPGAPNPTIMGSTYANNTTVSWGDIPAGGGDSAGTKIVPIDDIGVDSVVYHGTGTGWYTIYLDVLNPDNSRHNFTAGQAAITVSIGPTTTVAGGMITVTPLTGGTAPTFDVRTSIPSSPPALSGTYGFQFQVVAR